MYAKSLLLYPAKGRGLPTLNCCTDSCVAGSAETCWGTFRAACHPWKEAAICGFLCSASCTKSRRDVGAPPCSAMVGDSAVEAGFDGLGCSWAMALPASAIVPTTKAAVINDLRVHPKKPRVEPMDCIFPPQHKHEFVSTRTCRCTSASSDQRKDDQILRTVVAEESSPGGL